MNEIQCGDCKHCEPLGGKQGLCHYWGKGEEVLTKLDHIAIKCEPENRPKTWKKNESYHRK